MLVSALGRQTREMHGGPKSSMSMELALIFTILLREPPVLPPRLPAASWLYLKLLKNLLCPRFASWLGGRVLR